MKVLVTGGAGYIGSVATERLLDAGHAVTVFDSLERGHREAVDRRATLLAGDLRNAESILRAMKPTGPDAVMHFAAYALVGESMEHPDLYFANNVSGGINLLNAMLQARVRRIVFSSSCATYGQPQKVPILESAPQNPTNPYGESKLMFEKILAWCGKAYGIKASSLRYFNAAGATKKFGEDHDPETHLIPRVLQVALGTRPQVEIFGDDYNTPDGTCVRDYIHIADLAEAHLLALSCEDEGPFNLGNGDGYSVKQVIETAHKVTGREIPAIVARRRPGDPPRLVASSEKARKVLGWEPRHPDLRSIIQSAWDWAREHPAGYGRPVGRKR